MRPPWVCLLAAGLALAVCSGAAQCGVNANGKILIHLTGKTTKYQCTGTQAKPACNQQAINTTGLLVGPGPSFNYYYAYVLGYQDAIGTPSGGIAGIQLGIQYDGVWGSGVDVWSWNSCAACCGPPLWPQFPFDTNSGTQITWATCQPAPGPAVAGYMYLGAYSPDVLRIIPRPVDNQAKIADCNVVEDLIGGTGFPPGAGSHLGSVAFSADGSTPGYNPCGLVTPVQPTTWSGIKAGVPR